MLDSIAESVNKPTAIANGLVVTKHPVEFAFLQDSTIHPDYC